MNWEYEVFKEKESTRKTRPIQWDLYNRILTKEYDGILIYKFDRWARSTTELVNHLKEFEIRNIAKEKKAITLKLHNIELEDIFNALINDLYKFYNTLKSLLFNDYSLINNLIFNHYN